jgi:antitoxin component YwqK of YwqJK toxin-antitoxin module
MNKGKIYICYLLYKMELDLDLTPVFTKNFYDLKHNEIEKATLKSPLYFFNSDNQIEELTYRRKKLQNNYMIYYYLDKNNKRQADFYTYYPNGSLYMSATYLNNKLEGKCTTYFENGIKSSVYYYKNDKINGAYYGYSRNGNLIIYEEIKDSMIHGLSKRYCINGCCEIHLTYENNLIKHVEHYVQNNLVKSFDLNENESKKYDSSIGRRESNNHIYYYDPNINDILELKCIKSSNKKRKKNK